MTVSQYLGRGSTSRGRMTITPNLDTIVSTLPYLNDPHDKAAVVQALINVQGGAVEGGQPDLHLSQHDH